jgi:hypothetical protein
LRHDGLVQAELGPDGRDLALDLCRRKVARIVHEDLGDVPRHQAHEREDDDGHAQQRGYEQQQAAGDVLEHEFRIRVGRLPIPRPSRPGDGAWSDYFSSQTFMNVLLS